MTRLHRLALAALILWCPPVDAQEQARPNILWITSEDNGPHLGAYGDTYADTPHLDRLAARGMIYSNVWSNAPVCAPARTAIISGMYPTSTGSQHMRSMVRLPAGMKMYPQLLREAGYYCTNNSKEDYNLEKTGQVWDESSNRAHWRNRQPGQPFFAVFNHTITHESQIRARPHILRHDPRRVPLPAYHPDTPEVRQDWAQYYDRISEMDALAEQNLRELEAAGLSDDTIVFYYADHGSGMPRSKRWPYNSGLQVPLIVHVPERLRHLAPKDYAPGARSERLVGFVDLAPTVLSIAGIRPPDWMHGRAFMGAHEAPPQDYLHGFRDRMDERYDLVRSVRDRRYVYVRNYMPHLVYGQYLDYMFQTPTTQVWKRLYDQGLLSPPRTHFWEPKPPEELYDLESDPHEVHNLADSPAHRAVLERFRREQQEHVLRIRDTGFLPEAEIHRRSEGSTPHEAARDRAKYPLEKILAAAERASSRDMASVPELARSLRDGDSAIRYWAAMGILIRGKAAVEASRRELLQALGDPSPNVRIVAAEALGRFGTEAELGRALGALLELAPLDRNGIYISMPALNALDALDGRAARFADAIRALPTADPSVLSRLDSYVPRLIEKILADLE